MRWKLRTALVAALILVVGAVPALAVQFGTPDGDDHPYVGMSLFYDPSEELWFRCSGSLLDSDTFLSAGHCTFGVGDNGAPTADGRGGNDIWVTLQNPVDLTGFPTASQYETAEDLYEARRAYLEEDPDFVRGTSWPHPAYDNFATFPNTSDVGVVELDSAARDPIKSHKAYKGPVAQLPAEGAVNELWPSAHANEVPEMMVVGFGLQSVVPEVSADLERYQGEAFIKELNSANTGGWNIHLSGDPGEGNGEGSACFGDSGGPALIGTSDIVGGVGSFVLNPNCTGGSYYYRVDTAWALDFIGDPSGS